LPDAPEFMIPASIIQASTRSPEPDGKRGKDKSDG